MLFILITLYWLKSIFYTYKHKRIYPVQFHILSLSLSLSVVNRSLKHILLRLTNHCIKENPGYENITLSVYVKRAFSLFYVIWNLASKTCEIKNNLRYSKHNTVLGCQMPDFELRVGVARDLKIIAFQIKKKNKFPNKNSPRYRY